MYINVVCTFILLFLTACSAGSGGDGLLPPSVLGDPPSQSDTNAPPILMLSVSTTDVDERQSVVIQTAGSSDPDGDELTYEIDMGGMDYHAYERLDPLTEWTIETGEVDETTTYRLTVTASDGKDTTSEAFDLTVHNYDRSPLNKTWGDVSETYDVSQNGSARFAKNDTRSQFQLAHILRDSDDGKMEALEFEMTNGFGIPFVIPLDVPATPDAVLQTEMISSGRFKVGFSVTSETEDKAWVFRRDGATVATLTGELDLPGLCSASWTYARFSPTGVFTLNLFVGTANGLWLFINESARNQLNTENGAFLTADIYDGRVSGNFCAAGSFATFFDADRKDFIALESHEFGAPNFPETTPVNVPDNLELVTFKAGMLKYRVKYFALLFAGAEHTSAHQLTILHETPSGVIEQLDYALPPGKPSDLVVQSIDTNYLELQYTEGEGNRDADIVIAVPETPYVYVITVEADDLGGVTFGPLEYFEVGFDKKDIAVEVTDGTNRYSLITNDGETLRLHESQLVFSRF